MIIYYFQIHLYSLLVNMVTQKLCLYSVDPDFL